MSEEDQGYTESTMSSLEYEKLTQGIYQTLLKSEGLNTIEVKHNLKVTGKSGATHQIDVYWEHSVGGKKYLTLIECKHYKTSISIGHIRNFYGVLSDVTGATGIFVTKVGYQSGAQQFAKFYGIDTKLIKDVSEADLDGRIRKVQLTIHFKTVANDPPPVMILDITDKDTAGEPISQDFFDAQKQLDPRKSQHILGAQAYFRDLAGIPNNETIGEMLPALLPTLQKPAGGPYHETIILEDKYLLVFGRLIKVNGLKVTYHVDESIESSETADALNIYSHLLKDFESGDVQFLKKREN